MLSDKKKRSRRMTLLMFRRYERRAWRQYLKTGVLPRNLAIGQLQ